MVILQYQSNQLIRYSYNRMIAMHCLKDSQKCMSKFCTDYYIFQDNNRVIMIIMSLLKHFHVSVSTFLLTHAGLTVDIHMQVLASKSTADSSEYTTESSRKQL